MEPGKRSFPAALLDILGALCVFAALSVFFILWRPGQADVAFLVHLLCTLALGLCLFAGAMSGRPMRRPFSAPEGILLMIIAWNGISAARGTVLAPSFEHLLFLLDSLSLFYVGTTLFARRSEGFIVLSALFAAGLIFIPARPEFAASANKPSPSALYRGDRLIGAAFAERPLFGCGPGCLPSLAVHYLPLGDRHTPVFRNAWKVLAAETGLPGILLWLAMLLAFGFAVRKKLDTNPPSRSLVIRLSLLSAAVAGLITAAVFHPALSRPGLFLLLLLPTGTVLGLAEEGMSSPPETAPACPRRSRLLVVLMLFVPVLFCVAAVSALPVAAEFLIRIRRVSELGSDSYGARIRLAVRLAPWLPQVHRAEAKHLRALPAERMKGKMYLVDGAFLRMISANPFDPQSYMEYGHFLDLKKDNQALLNQLRKGRAKCPGSVEIRIFLSMVNLRMDLRNEALDEIHALWAFHPLDHAHGIRIARMLSEAGALTASHEAETMAVQVAPTFRREKP